MAHAGGLIATGQSKGCADCDICTTVKQHSGNLQIIVYEPTNQQHNLGYS